MEQPEASGTDTQFSTLTGAESDIDADNSLAEMYTDSNTRSNAVGSQITSVSHTNGSHAHNKKCVAAVRPKNQPECELHRTPEQQEQQKLDNGRNATAGARSSGAWEMQRNKITSSDQL